MPWSLGKIPVVLRYLQQCRDVKSCLPLNDPETETKQTNVNKSRAKRSYRYVPICICCAFKLSCAYSCYLPTYV
ncbi:hypothetical protein GE21DRAFT_1287649 [Neurospora crassa]|nr:hypothetical protein GE21DRAFT_1287649 [Neurospora crassa]